MKLPKLPSSKQIEKMTNAEIKAWWQWLEQTFDFSHAIGNEIEKRDLNV